jgi:PAS domain-containing protein
MECTLMSDSVERLECGPTPWRGDSRPNRNRVSVAAVLDTTSQGYLVFDGRMRVVLNNPQAARLLGLRHDAGRASLPQLLKGSNTLDASAQLALSQAVQAARCGDSTAEAQRVGGLQVSIRPLSREAGTPSPAGAGDGAFWLVSLATV